MSKAQETILEIHLNALTHNYNYLKNKLESKTKFLAVIKAFAYGSDCVEVAKHLETLNVDYFAVAYTNEGVLLRDAGVTTPILVLHPQAVNFKTIIERCLEPSIYSPKILKEFISVAEQENQKDYPVHLKFNTGLNRLGFWQNDIDIIASNLKKTKAIIAKSLFSHLAASEDENEEEFSLQQIKDFKAIATDFTSKMGYRPWLHLCNTSGVINYPEAHLDMVRCGIGLYGFGNSEKEDGNLYDNRTGQQIKKDDDEYLKWCEYEEKRRTKIKNTTEMTLEGMSSNMIQNLLTKGEIPDTKVAPFFRVYSRRLDEYIACYVNKYKIFGVLDTDNKDKILDTTQVKSQTVSLFPNQLQKYKKGEGHYNAWHCEWSPTPHDPSIMRTLISMLYLTDVDEGGHTQFYSQNLSVQPKAGRLILFPAYFTHTHRGQTPISNDKYIITAMFGFRQ